tara:strand:+ start:394 stop:582 length:189 start_codon:yes stop_codon:yes gene_type:complete
MKDMNKLKEVVHSIEMEMISLWSTGEVTHVIKDDPEFITMVMTAVHFDREHFRALGMVIGEA